MTFAPHLEILPPGQRAAWPRLRTAKELGFVLYGGTAIALRLGHGQSVDFDFFSNRPLDRDALFRAISPLGQAALSQDVADTLSVIVDPVGSEAETLKMLTYFEGGDLQALSEADRQFLTAKAGEVEHIPTVALKAPSLAA